MPLTTLPTGTTERTLADGLQQAIRRHVADRDMSLKDVATLTGHEVWAIEGMFSQTRWALGLALQVADQLGVEVALAAVGEG